MVFVDLDKAYDSIPQGVIWDSLKARGIDSKPVHFYCHYERDFPIYWETVPWCMLFADDIVLIAEIREEVSNKLDESREVLEGEPEVSIGEAIVKYTTKYKYLGSIIQRDGEIGGDVNHRIQASWIKWLAATAVLCVRKFPSRLKGKFYRMANSPALLYGTE
ncbi:uncharacterized protein LOC130803254 [Amaranthus tricolor]|uniref:uncharacterized protein LOC130803254 n=1 Tax=Amaranthus tricolor TaxID=29722 RepID=UPI002584DEA0|nr:uncharacterized protein LOC130803254 [Amaranthus tricolor]